MYAYEVGEKCSSPNDFIRINASAFYYNYRNYQAFAFHTLNGNPVGTIINQDAIVKGAEADLTVAPMAGLSLNVSPSYLNSKVKSVQLPDGTIVDRPLPQAPRWSGTSKCYVDIIADLNTAE